LLAQEIDNDNAKRLKTANVIFFIIYSSLKISPEFERT